MSVSPSPRAGLARPSPALLRWLGALVGVGLAAVTWATGGAPGLGERALYDLAASRLLPSVPPTADLVLVEVDDRALAALGERWPLSRSTWARVFQALAARHPSAVVVDILFDQPGPRDALELGDDILERLRATGLDQTPAGAALVTELETRLRAQDGDARLGEALSEAGVVILGAIGLQEPSPPSASGDAPPGPPLPLSSQGLRLQFQGMATSIAPLRMAAASGGTLNMLVDPDGVIRRYPYLQGAKDRAWPSLALATALHLYPERTEALLRAASIDSGAPLMRLPTVDWLPRVSLSDVLQADPKSVGLDLALRGKTLFLGVTATGLHGQSTLPGQIAVPGVEIHAFALDNLRAGRVMRSAGAIAAAGLLETAALLGLFLWRGRRARTLAGALGWAGLGLVLHTALVGWLAADLGWVLPFVPACVGLAWVSCTEAVARGEDLKRQRGALKRLFVRYPQAAPETAVPPAREDVR
ncbi:nucleotide cyclase [Corallococcus sp. H22C18031201]|uniref:CHASE2 domain-containing protein n=1 Tax=Citreicoccus inhibens TaxID=2849499 RepID=UPI000E7196D1|nr:CHASE2 domain-containing protein [Citreicoccus inhibens]MBU8898537.1 CHASE2 domain-containing protein [Citreicoccus inhibens]RJS24966.1 nucleotide cyclase [Corallococcus sp. H22C18031201]